MPVKNLSQMMNPGMIRTTGDCATCGPSGFPPTVTRVAIENMAKLNTPVSKAVEPPVPVSQPVQAVKPVEVLSPIKLKETDKSFAMLVGGEEEEEPKNKGGRPRLLTPNKPEEK